YTVTSSGRNFVVVGTEEFPVANLYSLTRSPFVFPKKGGRYAFSSRDPSNRNSLAIVDGKQVLPPGVYAYSDSVEFSENGARYAFVLGPIGRQGTAGFFDNGTVNDARQPVQFQKMGSETAPYFL